VLATGAFVSMYRLTRERPDAPDEPMPSLPTLLAATLRNPPFLVVLSAIMLVSTATTITGKVTVYYFTYYLRRPDLAGPALAIQVGSVILLTPVWAWVAHRASKRWAWLGGATIATLGQGLLLAYRGVDPATVLAIQALIAVGAAAVPVIFWSLAPDVVEVGEWNTGVRAEGAVFGLVTLGQKVALGVGIGLTGVLLDVIGYHPNAVQGPDAMRGLHAMIAIPALVGYAASGLAMAFYGLDGQKHRRLVRALAWRAARRRPA
jgi:GPH family glycoside/pentoside/hexuronide:cation symporter